MKTRFLEVKPTAYDIHLFGMKRSGHHAVLNWIMYHFSNQIHHYNNCYYKSDKLVIGSPNDFSQKGSGWVQRFLSFEDQPYVGNSFEDIVIKIQKPKKNILVLRDPYNTYASRLYKKRNPHDPYHSWNLNWENYIDFSVWKKYAYEFLGMTQHLQNCVKINYNKWFIDSVYRQSLSDHFGKFTDRGLNEIKEFGGGSSFDGISFNHKAQDMNVLDRWKKFETDSEFRAIADDKEINALSREIFDFCPF